MLPKAEAIGVTQGTISSWETGRVAAPRGQLEALERSLCSAEPLAGSSPSQDYGEWLRGRREAGLAGVSAVQIYNIETGRTLEPAREHAKSPWSERSTSRRRKSSCRLSSRVPRFGASGG